MLSNIYTINESGRITGFASGFFESSKGLRCACGSPFHRINRYSILKPISQVPTILDQLLAKIGKTLKTLSRRVHYHEKGLEESFHPFRNQIRPNPLAANQNRAFVTSRSHHLLRLSDRIQEFNASTAVAFERSISWLQRALPATLASITDRTIQPTFSLRLTILQRRARNAWIFDCLRVSKYLVGLEDPSLEVQRMGELLRVRASRECWKGIAECEEALAKAMTAKAPAIEVEMRLQQIQLSHLLNITLTSDLENRAPMPCMAPSESLDQATLLCRRFPDTAGRFLGIVNKFVQLKLKNKSRDAQRTSGAYQHTHALSSLPRTYNCEYRRTELAWGEHVIGSLEICRRAGHRNSRETKAFSTEVCPECGREMLKVEGMEEERRRAGECLFEDRFLEAMKRK